MTHLPTSVRTFASVEQLDELPRELGWPLEYRQLEPGSFSSTFTELEGDNWFLLEEQSSRRVEVVAGSPYGSYVLALAEGVPVTVNGKILSDDHIFLQTPGSDLRATIPANTKVTQVGISAELFEETTRAVAPDLPVPHGDIALFALAPGRLASVRWAMRAAIQAPSSREAVRDEVASNIVADLVSEAADQDQVKIGHDLHRVAAQRTLDRAKEYIEAHLDEAIRVASLCHYSGTTVSSLQRIFARELGVSPQQYVMARRLNAVRRRLLAAEEERDLRVTDVAQDHGFAHLGRFAGHYRRYFGESPRETLLNR